MTRNRKQSNTKDRLIYLGLILIGGIYVFALLGISILRAEVNQSERLLQYIPFSFVIDYARQELTIGELFKNVLGNFALYIPLGILLPCLFPTLTFKKTLWVGLLTSLCCELIQYIVAIGVADIDDWMLNTIGTLVGATLYYRLFRRTKTILRTRILALILLTIYGICGATIMLHYLPEVLPVKTEYVHLALLGKNAVDSYDLTGYCQELQEDHVTLNKNFIRDATGNSVPEDTPTTFHFSSEAVILLRRLSYKDLPNGYIYKNVFQYEASTIEDAQRVVAAQGDTECDVWIDQDGACSMLILTDMSA